MRSFLVYLVISYVETLETWWCWWWWFGVCLWKVGCPPILLFDAELCLSLWVFPAADWGLVHAGGISAVFWVCRRGLCDSKLWPESPYFTQLFSSSEFPIKISHRYFFLYRYVKKIYLSILKYIFIRKKVPLYLWKVFGESL